MAAPKGNQNAVKGKLFLAALMRALRKRSKSDQLEALTAIADGMVESATAKEAWAIKEIADRLDGKAHQSISGDLKSDVTLTISADDAGVL